MSNGKLMMHMKAKMLLLILCMIKKNQEKIIAIAVKCTHFQLGGVGAGGGWGAVGGLKQTLKQKWQCCAISG